MTTLLCLGLGYCARQYVAEFGSGFGRVVGTSRIPAEVSLRLGGSPVSMLAFDGHTASADISAAVIEADTLLISAAPSEAGDPVLAGLATALARARPRSVVYLSTVGVYGDHGGAWVDEETPPGPVSARSRARVAAEQAWRDYGASRGVPVAVLRLSGIYGPGQNALINVARGKARIIDKPGQVFNRIHVADIAQAIAACVRDRADGIINVTDDAPTAPGDPIRFAAALLNTAPPPATPFAEAARSMSAMAKSFYGESKRVRNDRLKQRLGVALRYPSYREGLQALFAAGER